MAPQSEIDTKDRASRDEGKALAKFLKEKCVRNPRAKATRRDLRGAYEVWRIDQGRVPMTAQDFTRRIRALDGVVERTVDLGDGARAGWVGVGLR